MGQLKRAGCSSFASFALDAAVYYLNSRWWLLKIFLHSEGIFFFAHLRLTGLF
jgi:hypothetical protein